MTKTYTAELLRTIRQQCPDIEFVDSNYTASGVEAVVRDRYDGQLYKIQIASHHPSRGLVTPPANPLILKGK